MLHEFISANRDELAKRCRIKSSARVAQGPSEATEHGIPLFIGQLIAMLRSEQAAPPQSEPMVLSPTLGSSAGKHGAELLRIGFTVDEVVHDYGDLCQALTELAQEKHETITVDEFHTFNRCLDDATAAAVTEFTRSRDQDASTAGAETMNERLGFLAHELRDQLNTAILAFGAIKTGAVAVAGTTGAVLDRSLLGLRDLIDRSLADVRLTAGLQLRREQISIEQLISEVRIPVAMEAATRHLAFSCSVEHGLMVDADRHMLSSAVANLLQNALKFHRARTAASRSPLAASPTASSSRSRTNVVACQQEAPRSCFHSFAQRGEDRSGLGLGLSISRRGVEANGGKLAVRDIPGTGCVFHDRSSARCLDQLIRRTTAIRCLVFRGHTGASIEAVRTSFLLTNSWMPMSPSSRRIPSS